MLRSLALSVRGINQNPFRRSNLVIYFEFNFVNTVIHSWYGKSVCFTQIIDLPVIGAHPICSTRFW